MTRSRTFLVVGLCAAIAVLVAYGAWSRNGAPAVPQTADAAGGPVDPGASTEGAQGNNATRSSAAAATTSSAGREAASGLERLVGPSIGALLEDEKQVVQAYVTQLRQDAQRELLAFREQNRTASDPEALAHEAELLLTESLWRSAQASLENGAYHLVLGYPERLPSGTKDVVAYQAMSAMHDGKQSAVIFILDDREYHDAVAYHEKRQSVVQGEARRLFNSLDYEQRRSLYADYVMAMKNGGYDRLGADMRRMFPAANWVDEGTLLMHTQR